MSERSSEIDDTAAALKHSAALLELLGVAAAWNFFFFSPRSVFGVLTAFPDYTASWPAVFRVVLDPSSKYGYPILSDHPSACMRLLHVHAIFMCILPFHDALFEDRINC